MMVDATWSLMFGKVPILAAEEIETGIGPNIKIDTAGVGPPYVSRIGESPDIIRMTCYIDKSYSQDFRLELNRTEPILVKGGDADNPLGDLYGTGAVYAYPLRPRHVASDLPDYRAVELPMVVLGDTENYKRCTTTAYDLYPNTFDKSGTLLIPLPIGAYGVSETATVVKRTTPEGVIQMAPSPGLETVTYSVNETDLPKGNVNITRSGKEVSIENGLVKYVSRNDESTNKGRFDYSVFDGSGWISVGTVGFAVKSSGGTVEYFDDKEPLVQPIFKKRNKEREILIITYPSSTTNGYKARVHLSLERGRPFSIMSITNLCTNTFLVEARVRMNMTLTSMRYHTRSGTERDATASVYGEETTSGDSDTYEYSVLHNDTPLGAAIYEYGFCRFKKVDCDHVANDAGNYWDSLAMKMDNVSLDLGVKFADFVHFGQLQSNTNTTVPNLALEAYISLNAYQTVTEVT